jgi:uncharacterized protein YsxB (DUF464 family)
MIDVILYYNKNNDIYRFEVSNHGEPIICAGVSALVINCVNFIQSHLKLEVVEKYTDSDYIDFEVNILKQGQRNSEASLLIDSMVYGLRDIEKAYGNEIKITEKQE